jgi:lipopolysaccharide/colanic/teichoic acid biosynthesis glycosyltransferase
LTITKIAPSQQAEHTVLEESAFQAMIARERKRTERSRNPFLLMLLDMGQAQTGGSGEIVLCKVLAALSLSTRETDVTGWYKSGCTVGVMFTEITIDERGAILTTLMARVSETLRSNLSLDQFNKIGISFHLFPEDWDQDMNQRPSNPTLYPDLVTRDESKRAFRAVKRVMDVCGSATALLFLAPVLAAIAVAIRMTSKGPVFFRQKRVGQHGNPFVLLKFRSMYMNNDARVHEDYVRKLIAGKAELKQTESGGAGVYKLTNDRRITKVGAFLRRTSLDELPQFLNVLKGEMSLVGPRPPISYELAAYDIWHRRRVLEAKPGVTGLWQVAGRSKVGFDDMVRLDLRYAQTWSPWMDLKILLRTPGAMFGEGAC